MYGHKPTFGVVPSQGHALPGMVARPDIAVVGPMARSAEDLALALEIVSGADPFNDRGWQLALPGPRKRSLAEYRVALWPDAAESPVSAAVSGRVQELGDHLAKLGATVSDTARPAIDAAASHRVYSSMLNGVLCAAIPDPAFAGMVEAARALDPADRTDATAPLFDTVQTPPGVGAAGSRPGAPAARLAGVLRGLGHPLVPADADHGVPPRPQPDHRAHALGRRSRSPVPAPALLGRADHGGLSAEHGVSDGARADGLPMGIQAVGAEFEDHTCIEFARLMAQEIGGFVAPPGYED